MLFGINLQLLCGRKALETHLGNCAILFFPAIQQTVVSQAQQDVDIATVDCIRVKDSIAPLAHILGQCHTMPELSTSKDYFNIVGHKGKFDKSRRALAFPFFFFFLVFSAFRKLQIFFVF